VLRSWSVGEIFALIDGPPRPKTAPKGPLDEYDQETRVEDRAKEQKRSWTWDGFLSVIDDAASPPSFFVWLGGRSRWLKWDAVTGAHSPIKASESADRQWLGTHSGS